MLAEVADIFLHSLGVPLVLMLRKIVRSDDAKLADFRERMNFRVPQQIGAITDVVRARSIASFGAGRMLFAGLGRSERPAIRGVVATVPGFRARREALLS